MPSTKPKSHQSSSKSQSQRSTTTTSPEMPPSQSRPRTQTMTSSHLTTSATTATAITTTQAATTTTTQATATAIASATHQTSKPSTSSDPQADAEHSEHLCDSTGETKSNDQQSSHPRRRQNTRLNRHQPHQQSSPLDSSQNSAVASSVIFYEDCELFDEIDKLYPHDYEGGEAATDHGNDGHSPMTSSRPHVFGLASGDVLHHLQRPHHYPQHHVPTDYDTLMASTIGGTPPADILLEDIKASLSIATHDPPQPHPPQHSERPSPHADARGDVARESIVGGKPISEMSFEERRRLLAPERSESSLLVESEDAAPVDGGGSGARRREGARPRAVCSYALEAADDVHGEGGHGVELLVSSVDWSSLAKSCRRAKNAFRDADSGLTVVKHMFSTHLSALTTVLTLYAKRYRREGESATAGDDFAGAESMDDVQARTTETKRALRFGMSCLAPPHGRGDRESSSILTSMAYSSFKVAATTAGGGGGRTSVPVVGSDFRDDVERYRGARRIRQELQEAAVEGTMSPSSTAAGSSPVGGGEDRRRFGLQFPLVEIVLGKKPWMAREENGWNEGSKPKTDDDDGALSSIERDQRTVRVLAARMLCNLVTDNPVAAEMVLMDVPFGPTPEEVERRMASTILGGDGGGRGSESTGSKTKKPNNFGQNRHKYQRETYNHCHPHESSHRPVHNFANDDDDDGWICWSDLITSTAKLQTIDDQRNDGRSDHSSGIDHYQDREALAAVAAALHNLLASLETRDSLLGLEHEMKRREKLKYLRSRFRRSSAFAEGYGSDEERDSLTPVDAGFEAASNRPLMNALLRNILPSKAVLMQCRSPTSVEESERSKFRTAKGKVESSFENTSDSATEWISLVLERLASRGLLPQMFQSAGGESATNATGDCSDPSSSSSSLTSAVTPEQVVLVSCIRQAVDDYHSARTPTGESGEFGRRRLSIAAKSAGMTVMTRPHPLWGRVEEDFGGGGVKVGVVGALREKPFGRGRRDASRHCIAAVPVLLFLSHEVETMRLKAQALQSTSSGAPTKGARITEVYEGELSCTTRTIDDIRDILSQSLGKHDLSFADQYVDSSLRKKQCVLSEARSVLGRETSLIQSCCMDLAKIVDTALANNSGCNARELKISSQEQQSAIVMVRLIGNIVYQCRYNQDLLRTTNIPMMKISNNSSGKDDSTSCNTAIIKRTGLHVLLSATSLAPACFTLREWCIVAIRTAVEDNDANAKAVQLLEANQALGDTPELRKLGVKLDLDSKGNVRVQRRDSA